MTFKIAASAALLATLPGLALAQDCGWKKDQTASMTCAEGATYDHDQRACVPVAS